MLLLIGDVVEVVCRVVEVQEPDVALSVLHWHKHRPLAAKPGQRVAIAGNIGVQEIELPDDGLDAGVVHDAGIELEELRPQHIGEEQPASPPRSCRASAAGTRSQPMSAAYFSMGFWTDVRSDMASPLRGIVRMHLVEFPLQRVVGDIVADALEFGRIADDVLVVVALPEGHAR